MSVANLVPERNLSFKPLSAYLAKGTIWTATMMKGKASETAWHGYVVTFLSKALIIGETIFSIPLILIETTASMALAGIAAAINMLRFEYRNQFLQKCTSRNVSFCLNSIAVLITMGMHSYMSIKGSVENEQTNIPFQISTITAAEAEYQNYLKNLVVECCKLIARSETLREHLRRDGIDANRLIQTQDPRIHLSIAAFTAIYEAGLAESNCPEEFSIRLNQYNQRSEKLDELVEQLLNLNEEGRDRILIHILQNSEPEEDRDRAIFSKARELGNDLLQGGLMKRSYFRVDTVHENNENFEIVNLFEMALEQAALEIIELGGEEDIAEANP